MRELLTAEEAASELMPEVETELPNNKFMSTVPSWQESSTIPVQRKKTPKKRGINAMGKLEGNWNHKRQRGYYLSDNGVRILEKIMHAFSLSGSSAIEMVLAEYFAGNAAKIEALRKAHLEK